MINSVLFQQRIRQLILNTYLVKDFHPFGINKYHELLKRDKFARLEVFFPFLVLLKYSLVTHVELLFPNFFNGSPLYIEVKSWYNSGRMDEMDKICILN